MAASMKDADSENLIDNHPIFKTLRSNLSSKYSSKYPKNIVEVVTSDIFVWDRQNLHLLTTNINVILANDLHYQTLLCTNQPLFDVDGICVSASGLYVVIYGALGVSVVELPRRCGQFAKFQNGCPKIVTKTIPIGVHLFQVNDKLKLLDVKWFSSHQSDNHLLLLTSDNYLRLFDALSPQLPVQAFCLAENTLYKSNFGSNLTLTIPAALGDEQAIAFDFGPTNQYLNKHIVKLPGEDIVSVFVLFGNGDVYCVLLNSSSFHREKYKPEIIGPLSMFPAAEDNYGNDATSIICLSTVPPVLVTATSSGKIYHSVVLGRTSSDDHDDVKSEISWTSSKMSSAMDGGQDPSLYVFESVELELALTTVSLETDEIVEDDFSCPIKLFKDPCSSNRYHCYHSAGVHSLILPWIAKLEEFCLNDELEEFLGGEQQSIVEHLLCTKPLVSSRDRPIQGVAVLSEPTLGTLLMVLTSDCHCLTLPLRSSIKTEPLPLLSDRHSTINSTSVSSPLRGVARESFTHHIEKILQKSSSNPILRSSKGSELTQQQCFQFLSRATQVFREQYIQKLDLAREEIEKRVKLLKEQKEQQQSELGLCKEERNELREGACIMADKIEIATENQESIVNRIETLLRRVQTLVPILSDDERNMQKDLTTMQEKMKHLTNAVQQIKIKNEYQSKQMSDLKKHEHIQGSRVISKTQTEQLKSALKQDGCSIGDLVQQVKEMRTSLDV